MSSNLAKEPIVLQFEEQERKFSPKRRHKEEEEDASDDIDESLLQQKNKVTRVAGTDITIEEGPASLQAKAQEILPLKSSSYEIPCILGPSSSVDTTSATRQTETQSGDRSSRNIAFLCARIAEELKKKGPQTRDELSSTTGFARQRICTVISVFKSIGLVNIRDSNTRRSEIEWNDQQAKLLPSVGQYVSKILHLRSENKELKAREQDLVRKLLEKRHNSTSSTNATTTTTMSSTILPSATIAPSPLLSLLSPQNSGTFGLEDEEKYGIQAKHMLGVDTSASSLTMLSGKAEGF